MTTSSRIVPWLLAGLLAVGGCTGATTANLDEPAAPTTPLGALTPAAAEDVDALIGSQVAGGLSPTLLERVVATGDARVAWVLADLLRFTYGEDAEALAAGVVTLVGTDPRNEGDHPWVAVSEQLIAWDLPAFPGYAQDKVALLTGYDARWAPLLHPDADIDWRLLSWGGVGIDDRPSGTSGLCERSCIPALDDPVLEPASAGDWYPDDGVVLGVVMEDEAVAIPRHQAQFHEMVNLTLGGRRLGIPYCTLCNSAQAYVTEGVAGADDDLVLRTSGLLVRSNKLMFDLTTMSAIDTFTGRAVSGPLYTVGTVLEQVTVVTSTWGEWRRAHPTTRVVAEDAGIGRTYELDPLDGRDDDGPIFPVGPVDPRLPVQAQVVGGFTGDGVPVAFAVEDAVRALRDGRDVRIDGVAAVLDGDGIRLVDEDGDEVVSHEAFWFAWSQFHPTTALWGAPSD